MNGWNQIVHEPKRQPIRIKQCLVQCQINTCCPPSTLGRTTARPDQTRSQNLPPCFSAVYKGCNFTIRGLCMFRYSAGSAKPIPAANGQTI